MKIELTDTWRITTDTYNFKLEEKVMVKSDKKGERLEWVRRGYYPGLESALKSIPDHIGLCETVQTLEDYLARLDSVSKQLVARMGK